VTPVQQKKIQEELKHYQFPFLSSIQLSKLAKDILSHKMPTPAQLAQLKTAFSQAQHLDLSVYPAFWALLSNEQFKPAEFDFDHLQTLTMPGGMNDELLNQLGVRLRENAPRFRCLNYHYSPKVTDKGLLNFVNLCPNLKVISLSEYALSRNSLSQLRQIEAVDWDETNFRPPLYAISSIPNIQHLKIRFTLLDGYLERLKVAQLDTLDLSRNRFIVPEILLGLNECPTLRKLTLTHCDGHFTDEVFSKLRLPLLEQLDLSHAIFEVDYEPGDPKCEPPKGRFALTLAGLAQFIQNNPALKAMVLTIDQYGLAIQDMETLKSRFPHIQFVYDSRELPPLAPRPPYERSIPDPLPQDRCREDRVIPRYGRPIQHNLIYKI
jgi:hypothetical protein